MNNRERIGLQVAELRNKRGYTTRQLAELSGLNHSNITKIEKGAYNASVDILSKLLSPLGAEIAIKEKATE